MTFSVGPMIGLTEGVTLMRVLLIEGRFIEDTQKMSPIIRYSYTI